MDESKLMTAASEIVVLVKQDQMKLVQTAKQLRELKKLAIDDQPEDFKEQLDHLQAQVDDLKISIAENKGSWKP